MPANNSEIKITAIQQRQINDNGRAVMGLEITFIYKSLGQFSATVPLADATAATIAAAIHTIADPVADAVSQFTS